MSTKISMLLPEIKRSSKADIFSLLSIVDGYFFHQFKSLLYLLRTANALEKLHVKLNKVLAIQVAQNKGLFIKDILKFARSDINIDNYLPKFEHSKKPNRQWL